MLHLGRSLLVTSLILLEAGLQQAAVAQSFCPEGAYDGANCRLLRKPANGFILNNCFYTTPQPSTTCTIGQYDGANCKLRPKPATGFIHANKFYIRPNEGGSCPEGTFDGANCLLLKAPWGTEAFEHNGSWYVTPDPDCPLGKYDGANCKIQCASPGTEAFEYDGMFYTTPTHSNPHNDPSSWSLTFNDEFDGSQLDSSKWKDRWPWFNAPSFTAYRTVNGENIRIEDGLLKIVQRREVYLGEYWHWPNSNDDLVKGHKEYNFTTAMLLSIRPFTYGFFEISCRMPESGVGVGANFWLWAFKDDTWNEIDIFEMDGEYPKMVTMNSHFGEDPGAGRPKHSDLNEFLSDADYTKSFHTFAGDWSAERIIYYIDGKVVYVSRNHPGEMSDMHIVVDVNIPASGKMPDHSTKFPNIYEVDYVRVYERR